MPELLLHIGTHKTGTTSIQRFCGANRDALRERGIWYAPASVGKFPDHYAHHRIAHAIADRDDNYDRADAADFFDQVRRQMKSSEKCLISAEPMYRHALPIQPRGGQARLSEAERNARYTTYAEAVRECLGEFDVTVLVMLRRQDLFLESLYAEQVLSTGYTRNIERFAVERGPLLDYEARLSGWASVFGEDRISVRVFDPSTLNVPIERDFVEWIGVEWDDGLRIGPRHNVTPSRAFVEFKRMMNVHGQPLAINNLYRRWLEQLIEEVPSEDVPDLGRYYLQPRDRVELLERYDAGNRLVAERYRADTTLFRDDVFKDLAAYVDRPQLNLRDFRELAKQMFRMIADAQNA
jgi:hypothetical protein